MAQTGSSDYAKAFITRVFSAREARGLTQEQIAHVLHTTQPTYAKYETRSLLPHRHIWTFCMACQVTIEWLITGQGKGVALLSRPEPVRRRGRKKKQPMAA